MRDTALNFLVEIDEWFMVFVVLVLLGGCSYLHRQRMIGGEPRRHALQSHEAANEQPGANQQHQRKRQLRNHQQSSQTVSSKMQTTVALSAASAGFQ